MVAVYPDLLGEQAPPPASDHVISTLTPLTVTRKHISKYHSKVHTYYIDTVYVKHLYKTLKMLHKMKW